jgi:hypothetical protein
LDLRYLDGVFIVFTRPSLVDIFGRTRLAWDFLGHESHRVDTMAHTLDGDEILWRSKHHFEELDVTIGIGFWWW